MYIGKSTNIAERFKQHTILLRCGQHFNIYLQRSYNKYGKDNFEFEILEECYEFDLHLNELKWIKYYGSESTNNGFNLKEPLQNGGQKHCEETRKRMSKIATGRKHTEETKQKLSIISKGKLTQGIINSANIRKKPITQYTMDGTFIRNWNSITEASLNLNLDKGNLGATIKNKYKHCGGFRWTLMGELLPPIKQRKVRDKSTYTGKRKKNHGVS